MTDTALTLGQLNTLFRSLTMTMLGFNPAVPAENKKVRIAWPKGGAPAWNIDDDMVSLRVFEEDDPYNRQRETQETRIEDYTLNQATNYTRVNAVMFVLYGPNSYDYAQRIRDQIFIESNRNVLARSNIYLIPEIVSPRRIPENFNGEWWERTDLTMHFNEKVVRNLTISTIDIVPLTVTLEDGTEVNTTIQ